jgi:hypothetical protein
MVNMRKIITGQIQEMRSCIEKYSGPEVCTEFFKGSEKAAKSTSPVDNALWMKEAIDRLDALTDAATSRQIMRDCGYHCQSVFNKEMKEARERRLKYKTEEEFLKDELNPPPGTGVRFERDGDIIYNYYTPRKYGKKGMRCYCYLIGALPDNIKASPTYCQCSRAWQEKYWEGALGRPVRVDLGKTAISSDSDECQFILHL